MIPKTCNACGAVGTAKLCSAYWAWFRADRVRSAYLQRLCTACMVQDVAPLVTAALQPVLMCPACGIETADDHDDVFLRLYVPGITDVESEMPLCGPCAAEVRTKALRGSTKLEDRESRLGAASSPQNSPPSDQIWRALGIEPRPARESRT